MKSVFVTALACLGLVWGASVAVAAENGGDEQEVQLFEGDKAKGAELSGTCVACHGTDGNSSNPQWPKIGGQHAAYIHEQLMAFKSGDRQNAIMAGQVANMSEQDMRDLGVFYAGQNMSPGLATEESIETGGKIYRGGVSSKNVPACSGCHGPSGLGNPGAIYPRVSGQHATYLEAQLKAYRSGERDNTRLSKIMTAVAENLTDAEIKALASYMSGLYPRGAE